MWDKDDFGERKNRDRGEIMYVMEVGMGGNGFEGGDGWREQIGQAR